MDQLHAVLRVRCVSRGRWSERLPKSLCGECDQCNMAIERL